MDLFFSGSITPPKRCRQRATLNSCCCFLLLHHPLPLVHSIPIDSSCERVGYRTQKMKECIVYWFFLWTCWLSYWEGHRGCCIDWGSYEEGETELQSRFPVELEHICFHILKYFILYHSYQYTLADIDNDHHWSPFWILFISY